MKNWKNQYGQGMTEYILIVALIAVAVITAVKVFGTSVTTGFTGAAAQIGTNTTASNAASGVASAASAVGH